MQEATLSQGSLLGLTSEKDQADRRRSFDRSRRRPTGRPRIEPTDTDPGYLNRMRDDTSSINMYDILEKAEDTLIEHGKFLEGAFEHVNSGLHEDTEHSEKGPDMFTLNMQGEARAARIKSIHNQMEAATDLSRGITLALEGMSEGIPFRDTNVSVPTGQLIDGKPEMQSLTINQIPGYIEQFIKGSEYNVNSLIPEYAEISGRVVGETKELRKHGGLAGGYDDDGNYRTYEEPETQTKYPLHGYSTDPEAELASWSAPHSGQLLRDSDAAADKAALEQQREITRLDDRRAVGEVPLSANKSTIENHYLFSGYDTGRESSNTILTRMGSDLEKEKLLNTEADPSIQQDIIEYYEGAKGELIVNPEKAMKEYNLRRYKDVPGMYSPAQISDKMLESFQNSQSKTVSLWASNEPVKRDLKIGYHEDPRVDMALDHILEFNRWHQGKFGVPFYTDMRDANNDPLLPSNFNDIATFSQKVGPRMLKDFIVDKFYQNFPDSSKGQFILDEDMDKVLLSYNTEDVPARSAEQIERDLAKVRDLINSGKLDLTPTKEGISTASDRQLTVKGTPAAYRSFINAWRRASGNLGVGRQILNQLNSSAGLGRGRKQDIANDALKAWDLIRQSNMSYDTRRPIRLEISEELQSRLDSAFMAWVRQEPVDWREPRTDIAVKERTDEKRMRRKLETLTDDVFYNYMPWNSWGN